MILFFYGDDSYRIKEQEKKLRQKFVDASLGDINLSILDVKTITYQEFARHIFAMPFLGKTRLVIADNILSASKKELQEKISEILKKVPKSTVLVFSQTSPDKRLGLFKKLLNADKVYEFKLLENDQLQRWIKKAVESRGAAIDNAAINKLIEYIGNDLWRQSNEIDKLVAYNESVNGESSPQNRQLTAEEKPITSAEIELLVSSKIEKDIFQLIDALGQKDLPKALRETENLVNSGENELYILSMIAFGMKNLLILKDLNERKKNKFTLGIGQKDRIESLCCAQNALTVG